MFRAPGRVNLIGEHTDYNDGWVMPAAIDLALCAAIASREDRQLRLHSEHYGEAAECSLDEPGTEAAVPVWSRSLRGVALLLDRWARTHGAAPLAGADLLLASDIPVGAGLSSSAAAEVAVGYALAVVAGIRIERADLAYLCQQASHEYAGSRCGIMDQYIACLGRRDAFARLDVRTLAVCWLPWPEASLVLCDTGVRHDNATNEYNQRRAECEAAVAVLRQTHPEMRSLRDLDTATLAASGAALPPPLFARCRHVVSENARVAAAAQALQAGDLESLGKLLNASHASLRDDYQVSCRELDLLAELCRQPPGVWGARMMGGGFGGCVLALARPEAVAGLRAQVPSAYARTTGLQTTIRVCYGADGVSDA